MLAVGEVDLVAHVRRRRQQVEAVLALQPLAHDLHVEQAEEAAAEAEAERLGGLRLPGQRGVVEGQLLERVAQVFVAVGVDREEPAEDHRPHLAVALQRLGGGPLAGGQRVADAQLGDVLDAGDQVADVAGVHALHAGHRRPEEADVVDVGLGAVLHRQDPLVLAEGAVDHPHVGDHAAVLVELGVEDQRPGRRLGLALRRRDALDDRLQHLDHPLPGLGRDPQRFLGVAAEQVGDLLRDPLGLGARQVDLVDDRDQLQPVLDRQVGVGDGLRLDPLGGVDDEQGALAGGEAARDLVGEVDVAGRVDQVQVVGLPVGGRVLDPHRLRLDRDPALALEVHRVEHLGLHFLRVDGAGDLEDAVGQGRLAVVDVGDDREVADVVHRRVRSMATEVLGRRVLSCGGGAILALRAAPGKGISRDAG